jgi:hypothetical protein
MSGRPTYTLTVGAVDPYPYDRSYVRFNVERVVNESTFRMPYHFTFDEVNTSFILSTTKNLSNLFVNATYWNQQFRELQEALDNVGLELRGCVDADGEHYFWA